MKRKQDTISDLEIDNLREFVFNSRHPDPRRVLGRCGAAVRGPDPRDPRDPGMCSLFRILGVFCDRSETLTPPEPPWGPQAAQGGSGAAPGALGGPEEGPEEPWGSPGTPYI